MNDAPVNTVPGAQTVNEDTALSFTAVPQVNDVDGNLRPTTALTVGNGTVNVSSLAGGATINAGANGSATLRLAGTQAQINAALATLSYQAVGDYNGADTLTVVSTDSDAVRVDTDTVAITVTAVNDAPVNTVPGAQTVNEDTTLTFAGRISVNDVDGNLATTALTVGNGTVTVSLAGGATISAGANGTDPDPVGDAGADQRGAGDLDQLPGSLNFNGAGHADGAHDRQRGGAADGHGHGGDHGDGGERCAGEHGAWRADGQRGHGAGDCRGHGERCGRQHERRRS